MCQPCSLVSCCNQTSLIDNSLSKDKVNFCSCYSLLLCVISGRETRLPLVLFLFLIIHTQKLVNISYLFARLFFEKATLKITYWHDSREGQPLRPHHRLYSLTTASGCILPEADSETGIQVQKGEPLSKQPLPETPFGEWEAETRKKKSPQWGLSSLLLGCPWNLQWAGHFRFNPSKLGTCCSPAQQHWLLRYRAELYP